MKQAWERLVGRINQLSLRERVIVFVMIIVVIVALFNAVLFDPLSAKEKALSEELLQMNDEMQSLQIETLGLIKIWTDNPDPNAALQSRLLEKRNQLARLDVLLNEKQLQLIAPSEITKVLKTILMQNRELQLVSLNSLPTTPLIEPLFKDETQLVINQTEPSSPPQSEEDVQIFKHRVEITVKGGYFDLLTYLNELEEIPAQMFWDYVSLNVEEHPSAILTLMVYTLSLDEAWLKV